MPLTNQTTDCYIGHRPHPGGLNLTQTCLHLLALPQNARVLDAGCGSGQTVAFLNQNGFQVQGIDQRKVFQSFLPGSNACFVNADWVDIPFPDGTYDVVFAECTFSTTPSLKPYLNEISRVLKPKGKLAFHGLYSRIEDADTRGKLETGCSFINIRTRKQLTASIVEAGFEIFHWEDQSWRLKQNGGNLFQINWKNNLFCDQSENNKNDVFDFFLSVAQLKIGYYLGIAMKGG